MGSSTGDAKHAPHSTSTSTGQNVSGAGSQVPLKSYSTQPFPLSGSGAPPTSTGTRPPVAVGHPSQVFLIIRSFC